MCRLPSNVFYRFGEAIDMTPEPTKAQALWYGVFGTTTIIILAAISAVGVCAILRGCY